MGKHQVTLVDAKSSSKGQVTIPAEIRELIGLRPGGSVQFFVSEKGEVTIAAKRPNIAHLIGIFGPQPSPVDVDEAIMETAWERNRPNGGEVDE